MSHDCKRKRRRDCVVERRIHQNYRERERRVAAQEGRRKGLGTLKHQNRFCP